MWGGVSGWNCLLQCQQCPQNETLEMQGLIAEKRKQDLLSQCWWLEVGLHRGFHQDLLQPCRQPCRQLPAASVSPLGSGGARKHQGVALPALHTERSLYSALSQSPDPLQYCFLSAHEVQGLRGYKTGSPLPSCLLAAQCLYGETADKHLLPGLERWACPVVGRGAGPGQRVKVGILWRNCS